MKIKEFLDKYRTYYSSSTISIPIKGDEVYLSEMERRYLDVILNEIKSSYHKLIEDSRLLYLNRFYIFDVLNDKYGKDEHFKYKITPNIENVLNELGYKIEVDFSITFIKISW